MADADVIENLEAITSQARAESDSPDPLESMDAYIQMQPHVIRLQNEQQGSMGTHGYINVGSDRRERLLDTVSQLHARPRILSEPAGNTDVSILDDKVAPLGDLPDPLTANELFYTGNDFSFYSWKFRVTVQHGWPDYGRAGSSNTFKRSVLQQRLTTRINETLSVQFLATRLWTSSTTTTPSKTTECYIVRFYPSF